MKNAINWFEVPVNDFDRAKKFYETILGEPLQEALFEGERNAFFPYDQKEGAIGGSIRLAENELTPSSDGVLIYLNANPNLSSILERIEGAGGRVALPKTLIREDIGYMAIFHDSEGNRLALHSQK